MKNKTLIFTLRVFIIRKMIIKLKDGPMETIRENGAVSVFILSSLSLNSRPLIIIMRKITSDKYCHAANSINFLSK